MVYNTDIGLQYINEHIIYTTKIETNPSYRAGGKRVRHIKSGDCVQMGRNPKQIAIVINYIPKESSQNSSIIDNQVGDPMLPAGAAYGVASRVATITNEQVTDWS